MKKLICIRDMLNPSGMRTCVYKRGVFLGAQSIKEKNGRYYPVDVTQWCEVTEGREFTIVDYQNQYMVTEAVLFFFATAEEEKDPNALSLLDGSSEGIWESDFEVQFEKDHGYSILPYLYALFYEPLTEVEKKVRTDYVYTSKRLYGRKEAPTEVVIKEEIDGMPPIIPQYAQKNVITGSGDMTFEAKGGNVLPVRYYQVYDPETDSMRCGEGPLAFPKGLYLEDGQTYQASSEVYFEYIPTPVFLHIEKHSVAQLQINGKRVVFHSDTEQDVVVQAEKYLQIGKNTIQITGLTSAAAKVKRLPFLFFSGRFLVGESDRAEKYREFIHFGSWVSQGYKYFGGEGIYRTRVGVYGMNNDSHIRPWTTALFECDINGTAEIYISGMYVGKITGKQGRLDITKWLHSNTNEITIVIKSTYSGLQRTMTDNRNCIDEISDCGIIKPFTIELYK